MVLSISDRLSEPVALFKSLFGQSNSQNVGIVAKHTYGNMPGKEKDETNCLQRWMIEFLKIDDGRAHGGFINIDRDRMDDCKSVYTGQI